MKTSDEQILLTRQNVQEPELTTGMSNTYATKPSSLTKKAPHTQRETVFSNVVKLQTIESNLYLGFGFSVNPMPDNNMSLHTEVVVSSETAKQLFLSLAELFQCQVSPK